MSIQYLSYKPNFNELMNVSDASALERLKHNIKNAYDVLKDW